MKFFIDTLRTLIPNVSIGSDHSVHLVLRTVDWQQHHSLVMSLDEAREIATKLLHAAANITMRESEAQVPVAATLDEAAADPALTLDVARELLRDAAAGIRSLAASTTPRTEPAEGQESECPWGGCGDCVGHEAIQPAGDGAHSTGGGEQSMNKINDGGPAFPVWELNGKDQPEMTGFGMTLRDYFAARAMQSLLVTNDTYPDEHWRDGLAIDAYMMADAMLKAREASSE